MRRSIEKKEKEEEKVLKKEKRKKASRVSSNKKEVNILRGEKHFNFKKSFYMIPFSPPPSYHFKNLF
jgi:hypothetical protein